MQNLETLMVKIPEYAKDIKLNLSSVLKENPESSLKINQIYSIALACAYAAKNNSLVIAVLNETKQVISETETNAAKAAAALMAMNNIYYRFVHLVSDHDYSKMPAGLRMGVIANSGVDKKDFELYSLAISAINGCGLCIDSHVKHLEHSQVSKVTIQHTIRIAAVTNAVAQSLFMENFG